MRRPSPATKLDVWKGARRRWPVLAVGAALSLASGCASGQPSTRPAKLSDRADEALRDPFGYKPTFDQQDVSGGGLTDLDKDALKRDVDHVLNP